MEQRCAAAAEQMSLLPAVKAPEISTVQLQKEIPDWLARWELARVLSYVKRYEEAVSEYRKLIREKPNLAEARIELANVLFWQGKKEQALKEMEAVPSGAMSDKAKVLMADLYAAQK
ncbi:MAG: tetratricopeptide repeat protein, partial [Atribacterota bacterium]|nr:tetratricopeptide repeat protein [Atribacterota bacterium]